MKTALVVICTGEKYWQYLRPLLASARLFFPPHETLVFTDAPGSYAPQQKHLADRGFPETTLRRYHTMLTEQCWLARFDQIFYCDVDMLFVNPIAIEDIASDGITATLHPGWADPVGCPEGYDPRRPFEDRRASAAYVDINLASRYYCGGFVGGAAPAFLKMAELIKAAVDQDARNAILARWHDESHLNRFLFERPPANTLSPSYCYPAPRQRQYYRTIWGKDYEPRLVALEKLWKAA